MHITDVLTKDTKQGVWVWSLQTKSGTTSEAYYWEASYQTIVLRFEFFYCPTPRCGVVWYPPLTVNGNTINFYSYIVDDALIGYLLQRALQPRSHPRLNASGILTDSVAFCCSLDYIIHINHLRQHHYTSIFKLNFFSAWANLFLVPVIQQQNIRSTEKNKLKEDNLLS